MEAIGQGGLGAARVMHIVPLSRAVSNVELSLGSAVLNEVRHTNKDRPVPSLGSLVCYIIASISER